MWPGVGGGGGRACGATLGVTCAPMAPVLGTVRSCALEGGKGWRGMWRYLRCQVRTHGPNIFSLQTTEGDHNI